MSTSTEPTRLLDVADVKAELARIIAANPDKRNPEEDAGGRCLYTDPDDPSRHCIVGQLATDRGWPFDGGAHVGAAALAETFGWPVTTEARRYLAQVQLFADGGWTPQRWADVDIERAAAIASGEQE